MRKRVVSFLLALLLVFGVCLFPRMDSHAVTAEDVQELKNQQKDLEKQKKELQEKYKALVNDKATQMEKKRVLENEISYMQEQIRLQEQIIKNYETLIEEQKKELEEYEDKEQHQTELFHKRVRDMEEHGYVNYWSILFNASSFTDLLSRLSDIGEIMRYDESIIDAIKEIQEQIKQKKLELEIVLEEQQEARLELVSRKNELKSQQSSVEELIDSISENIEATEKAEEEMAAAAKEMDKRVKEMEELYRQELMRQAIQSEGAFLWPLPLQWTTISSLYGGRIHPITKQYGNHTGIDVPAYGGTSIYAAKSGIVMTSSYDSSYGNYVLIQHSDRTSTCYAHMVRRNCKEDDVVTQGQVIGYVGTTGSSTGNHLHFEIRVNGNRTDPLNYYPYMTLYLRSDGKLIELKH